MLMEIEAVCFPFPWSREMFEAELTHPWAFIEVIRLDGPGGGPIVAYHDFWIVPGEAHLLSIAVHPDWRRRGLASFLLHRLVAAARHASAQLIVLEVRESNRPARDLYEEFGFRFSRLRKGYYSDSGEDALEMVLPIEPMEDDEDF